MASAASSASGTAGGQLDLGRVAVALSGAATSGEVLDVIADVAFPLTGADGLLLSLVRGRQVTLVRYLGYTPALPAALADLPLDAATPLAECAASRTPLFLRSREEYLARYPLLRDVVERSGKRAWAFLPLVASDVAIGTLLLSHVERHDFSPAKQAQLLALAGLCAQSLERARLFEGTQQVADALQRALLPAGLPDLPGLAYAARYRPAATPELVVGGDWFDVLAQSDGSFVLSIGDVVGHDVHAAALMGETRHTLRAFASEGHGPSGVLHRVNRLLVAPSGATTPLLADAELASAGERLATCCYLQADPASGAVTAVSAGHPAPILLRDGRAPQQLRLEPSLPLGTFHDATFAESTTVLEPNDVLVLFTDGLVEAPALPVGEGIRRLLETLAELPHDAVDELADGVLRACGTSSGDDVAILVVCYQPLRPPVRRARRRFADEAVSVPLARRYVLDLLAAWQAGDTAEVAELVTAELVTNAVAHTVGHCDVELVVEPHAVRLAVSDRSTRLPVEPRPLEPDDEGGRGLLIVDTLADEWGVEHHGGGKTVWAVLFRRGGG